MSIIREDPLESDYITSEYDLSAGAPISQPSKPRTKGEDLESIMEACFAEKACRISEIRVKHEMKIRELE
jgi:hypothetical protein